MPLFPPAPEAPPDWERLAHAEEALMGAGGETAALALGIGRMLRVVERKEARARHALPR
jgi:hypothetical protein